MKTRNSLLLLSASCLLLGFPGAARAQAPSDAPPKVIRIYVEDVKPGRGAAHEKHEAGWPAAFARANFSVHYIGMTSMSGSNTAWFVEPHDSVASLESDDKEMEKNPTLQADLEALAPRESDLLNGQRAMIARYREDLSYRPAPVNIGRAHYIGVWIERAKPGYDDEYEESSKMDVAAFTKAGINSVRWIAYEAAAGSQGGTYLYFAPMTSLADLDVDYGKAFREAMGESGRARQKEINRQGLASSEFQLFAVSPKMSYMAKEVVAADPDFWTPKPVTKPAAGKVETKPKP